MFLQQNGLTVANLLNTDIAMDNIYYMQQETLQVKLLDFKLGKK